MWLRLLGAFLVVVSCTGLGVGAAARLKERRRLLETMKRMVSHLKGEILYANAALPAALSRTGKRGEGVLAEFFCAVADCLESGEGETFAQVWSREAKRVLRRCPLSAAGREALLSFGKNLGYLDREMQEKTIQFYLEELDLEIARLRGEEPEKSRLFFSMGILSGLFLTVILL
mgnify:FL=1